VERSGDGLERVRRVGELVCADDAGPARGRQEEAVIGPDERPLLTVAKRERSPRPSDAGIDDRQMDADRHEADRVRENERTLEHRLGRDPVRDVDDLRLRRDALHPPPCRLKSSRPEVART
jgi:hypothetical protein